MRAAVDKVKDLSRVEELFETPQELNPLVVAALGVDEDQERAGAGRRTGSLPEACGKFELLANNKKGSRPPHWWPDE